MTLERPETVMSPRRPDPARKLIVGITGASGAIYALRLLEKLEYLRKAYVNVFVVYTRKAAEIAALELGIELGAKAKELGADAVYGESDMSSPLSSSSNLVSTDMVVVPASVNTIAKLAAGEQDNLLLRAALGVLRLRNRLVLVPRETPLSTIDLRNMYRLSAMGAIVLPACPGFYTRPKSLEDLVDFVVGKILDALGVDHDLYPRWARGLA